MNAFLFWVTIGAVLLIPISIYSNMADDPQQAPALNAWLHSRSTVAWSVAIIVVMVVSGVGFVIYLGVTGAREARENMRIRLTLMEQQRRRQR